MKIWSILSVFGVLYVSPATSWASPSSTRIYEGKLAEECQWPTAVGMISGDVVCSGTLIHPEVILTAAHCIQGDGSADVYFGENIEQPAISVGANCQRNPFYWGVIGESDYAYCRLSKAIEDIPPTPVLAGCEVEALHAGASVSIVGFGEVENGDLGVKMWAETTISNDEIGSTVFIGETGPTACRGDSGGPAYIKLEDGGWRAFGIVSGGDQNCGNGAIYVTMHSMLSWVENDTGLDLSPCFDAHDGSWEADNPECGGIALAPEQVDSWGTMCGGPTSGPSESCGAGYSDPFDDTPPIVAIATPEDQQLFEGEEALIQVQVEAQDMSVFGVEHVELYVDGELGGTVMLDEQEPWEFSGLAFLEGTHELVALARDYAGNEAESEPVVFYVGEVPEGEEGGLEEEGGSSSGFDSEGESDGTAEGSEAGFEEGGVDSDGGLGEGGASSGSGTSASSSFEIIDGEVAEQGCGCRSDGRGEGGALSFSALLLLGGLWRRRRASF